MTVANMTKCAPPHLIEQSEKVQLSSTPTWTSGCPLEYAPVPK